jgi:hypothetical protein
MKQKKSYCGWISSAADEVCLPQDAKDWSKNPGVILKKVLKILFGIPQTIITPGAGLHIVN